MIALGLQFFFSNGSVFVDGFHFQEGVQSRDGIEMKFYIADEIDPSAFIHHGFNTEGFDQYILQCAVWLVLV